MKMYISTVTVLIFLHCWCTEGQDVSYSKLETVKFSTVHGPKIELFENDTVARRYEGYCWSVCLSDRPLRVGETLHFNITEIETGWMANLNVGIIYMKSPLDLPPGSLVTCDANLSVSILDTEVFVFEKFYSSDNVYTFRVDENGTAYLSPNVTYNDVVFTGVDVTKTFFAILNIFGDSKAVKLLGLS